MLRRGYILLFLCLWMGALWADDRVKPAMQIEDNTFFDLRPDSRNTGSVRKESVIRKCI